jgi:hypothetical protein
VRFANPRTAIEGRGVVSFTRMTGPRCQWGGCDEWRGVGGRMEKKLVRYQGCFSQGHFSLVLIANRRKPIANRPREYPPAESSRIFVVAHVN